MIVEYKLLIKQFRKQARLTQTELANKAKINQSYLSQLERNLPHAKSPTLRTLFKIAAALNTCPNLLITVDDKCGECCAQTCRLLP
jgi:transcriptional regulator with XRE-family HTH domain